MVKHPETRSVATAGTLNRISFRVLGFGFGVLGFNPPKPQSCLAVWRVALTKLRNTPQTLITVWGMVFVACCKGGGWV